MGGGMVQLSMYGAQDIILTGTPQITYFKLVWRRHTLFSMDDVAQVFQGEADFGRKVTCPLSRNGDLVTQIWLQITLPDLSEFSHTAQAPTSTAPAIWSARYTSSTSARIKVKEPTGPTTGLFRVLATGSAGSREFTSSTTTIDLTDLDPVDVKAGAYTVRVRRGEGASSPEERIISVRWCDSIGHALIRSCELEIGGSRIDRHVSEWYDVWSELTLPEEKKAGFHEMIGKNASYDLYNNSNYSSKVLYVPLLFFFNRSPGLALPMVALQYHGISLNFEFRDYLETIKATAGTDVDGYQNDLAITMLLDEAGRPPMMDVQLNARYIFLDAEERRRYASTAHEYLIEQLQFLGDAPVRINEGDPNLTKKISLNFSHPVKELIWVYNESKTYNARITQDQYAVQGNDYFNTGLNDGTDDDPFVSVKLSLNGHDRFVERPAEYFRLCVPYMHHTRCPSKKIYCYSFALHPEEFQPSGSCNFSRVDTAHLVAKMKEGVDGRVRTFALGYNVLRIAQGMAGLSFSS